MFEQDGPSLYLTARGVMVEGKTSTRPGYSKSCPNWPWTLLEMEKVDFMPKDVLNASSVHAWGSASVCPGVFTSLSGSRRSCARPGWHGDTTGALKDQRWGLRWKRINLQKHNYAHQGQMLHIFGQILSTNKFLKISSLNFGIWKRNL